MIAAHPRFDILRRRYALISDHLLGSCDGLRCLFFITQDAINMQQTSVTAILDAPPVAARVVLDARPQFAIDRQTVQITAFAVDVDGSIASRVSLMSRVSLFGHGHFSRGCCSA
jgi:hypothetical protein